MMITCVNDSPTKNTQLSIFAGRSTTKPNFFQIRSLVLLTNQATDSEPLRQLESGGPGAEFSL